jgi:hypothetical protein
MKSEDRDSIAYSYIILRKGEERLKKICEDISITEIEFEDIVSTINNELRHLDREI